jgi:hypothetical protein
MEDLGPPSNGVEASFHLTPALREQLSSTACVRGPGDLKEDPSWKSDWETVSSVTGTRAT